MIWDEYTHLMADHNIIAEEDNTSLVREEAYKRPGPIGRLDDRKLTIGGRATSLGYALVVKESGTYRMWYQARGVREALGRQARTERKRFASSKAEEAGKHSYLAYAESSDGVHFRPVNVGQVEMDGSKRNNLLEPDSGGEPRTRQCGFMRDPLDNEYPYKCLYYRPATGNDLEPGALARYPHLRQRNWWVVWGIGRSKDGLVWEPPRHAHNLVAANPEQAKMHRALDGGMVLSDQMMSAISDWQYRNVKGWITYDLRTAHRIPDHVFKVHEHMVRCFHEFVGPNWDGVPWIQPHVGLVCARKGPSVIALNGYLYGCCGREPGAETFAQVTDVGLCVSPNGVKFQEVWPFRPFIRRGMRGEWDCGMVVQTNIVDDGDETRFYYTGNGQGNLSAPYALGMAYIPRDRYGYRLIRGYRDVAVRPRRGELTLTPLALPEKPKLSVNCSNVSTKKTIRMELRDETGRVLRGYSMGNCTPVTREGLKCGVRWKGGRCGAELGGRRVQVRVRLDSAACGHVCHDSPRLYAIYTA